LFVHFRVRLCHGFVLNRHLGGWKEEGYLKRLRPRLFNDVRLLGVIRSKADSTLWMRWLFLTMLPKGLGSGQNN